MMTLGVLSRAAANPTALAKAQRWRAGLVWFFQLREVRGQFVEFDDAQKVEA